MADRIPKAEVRVSFARSSGAGGQNVNKVNSKVVVRWDPQESSCLTATQKLRFADLFGHRLTSQGEVVISSERFRDQPRNLQDAMDKLQAMVDQARIRPKVRKKTKPTAASKRRRLDKKRRDGEKKQSRRYRPD